MLPRSYLTAEQLNIPKWVHTTLINLLGQMERGELRHMRTESMGLNNDEDPRPLINMRYWSEVTDCGTVHCIGGHIERLAKRKMPSVYSTPNLDIALCRLFFPQCSGHYDDITMDQMIVATRSYLTIGEADWGGPAITIDSNAED